MSRLAGRLEGWTRWVERELEVDRRLVGLIWLRLWGVVLSRTTRLLTGLGSRLPTGLEGFDDLPSYCALADRRCRRLSVADEVDAFNALTRRRVLGGDGCCSTDSGAPSLRRAFVRALSFIGTGISSSELSSWNCCCWPFDMAPLEEAGWLSLRFMSGLEGSRLSACRWDVLRTSPAPMGVGETVAMVVVVVEACLGGWECRYWLAIRV